MWWGMRGEEGQKQRSVTSTENDDEKLQEGGTV